MTPSPTESLLNPLPPSNERKAVCPVGGWVGGWVWGLWAMGGWLMRRRSGLRSSVALRSQASERTVTGRPAFQSTKPVESIARRAARSIEPIDAHGTRWGEDVGANRCWVRLSQSRFVVVPSRRKEDIFARAPRRAVFFSLLCSMLVVGSCSAAPIMCLLQPVCLIDRSGCGRLV